MDKLIIDFDIENWKQQISALSGKKINDLEFLNYQDKYATEIPSEHFPVFRNITFRKGSITEFPEVLLNQDEINLLSFVEIEILGPLENLNRIKELKRLQLYGGQIHEFPLSILNISGLEVLFIWETSIINLDYDFGKLIDLKQLSFLTNPKLESFPFNLHLCKKLDDVDVFGCDKLERLQIDKSNSIQKMRFGSYDENYKVPDGLKNLSNLKSLMVDNYRNDDIDLQFIHELEQLETVKISKLSENNIDVITSKTSIRKLTIGYISSSNEHLPTPFSTLKALEELQFGNIKKFRMDNVKACLDSMDHLKVVRLDNSSWSKKEIANLKTRYSKINLMIYN